MPFDPLAALEQADPSKPQPEPTAALATVGPDPVQIPTEALEAARARIVELEGRIADAEARAASAMESKENSRGLLGRGKHVKDLEAKVAELKGEVAKLKAERQAEKNSEHFLPAVVGLNAALAQTEQKFAMQLSAMETALQQAELSRDQAIRTSENLEYQRDERDDMLRKEEARRQQADQDLDKARRQVSLMRLEHLRRCDPGRQKGDPNVTLARQRLLAALGNTATQIGLGCLDNVCPFCKASPACAKTRLLIWPHGGLVPRQIQDYLQLLVDEAQAQNGDPYLALESWASGVSMNDDFGPQAGEPQEQEAEA